MVELKVDELEALARALSIATEGRLMSLEHGGVIFKKYLKDIGLDVPKVVTPVKGVVEKEEVK